MPAKQSAQSIRKQARERAVEAAAKRERLARQRFEELRTKQRAQAKANEEDLAAYFGAEASIADAEERLAVVRQTSVVLMSEAAQAIADREGSLSAAAQLLGVAPAKVSAIIKAGGQRTSPNARGVEPSSTPQTSSSTGGKGHATDDTSATSAPNEAVSEQAVFL